ncbi:MAG: autotransporter-associated beta strand repeat-containing protein, partial [bacterium]
MKTLKARYALLIAVGLLMTMKLSATTYTNTALAGLWSTPGSWLGTPPLPGGATDAVIILNPSANAVITNDMSGAFFLNQLKMVANKNETLQSVGTASLSFAGSDASITNAGGGNFFINSPITLGANLMVGNGSSVKLTLSSNITETVASGLILNSESARLVYLAGSNTFSGGVTLNSGGVEVNNAASLGTGTFTINNGTTFNNIGPSTVALTNASVWNGSITYIGSSANITMNGPIALGTNVALAVNGYTVTVNGNITGPGSLTKAGTGVFTLGGTNSFSGDFVWSGPLNVYSASGLPLGSGSLTISNGLMLSITPTGSGSSVALLGGTNGNETISFDGYTRLYINKSSQSSVTYTFGNAADTGSVFTRIGKGTLAIGNQASSTIAIGDANGKFLVANGATGVPIHNGMVDAYIAAEGLGGQWSFDFLQYDAVNGLTNLTFDGIFSGTSAGIQDSTKKYKVTNNSFPILTNNTAVYALSLQGNATMTLSNNATLTIGNGAQPAGLNITGGSLSRAANSSGSKLSFGTSEGIIYTGTAGAIIGVPIEGTSGMIFNAGYGSGSITLTNANTYSGDTTVIAGKLNVGSGGTSGDLGNSTNLMIIAGSTLSFNRSDILNRTDTMSGAGTLQNGGVGTLNLTPPSGTTFAGTLANASSGIMNLTLSSNTLTTVQNTLSGTMTVTVGNSTLTTVQNTLSGTMTVTVGNSTLTTVQNTGVGTLTVRALSGASNTFANINNNSTGSLVLDGVGSTNILSGQFNGAAGGTLVFSNGYYSSPGQRFTKGNLTIAGGTFVVGSRLGFGNQSDGQTMTITSGSLILNSAYGIQFGAEGPSVAGNTSATVNQSGGLVSVLAAGSASAMQVGGITASKTDVYNLSGGTVNLVSGYSGQSLIIGADAGGTTLAKFSMTGGKLISAGSISGSQGTGAKQVFDFSGGTLTASTIDATKLSSAASPSVQGTLVNNDGTLAPGDIGTAGKTTITGSYSNTPSAVVAIDIGGVKQADVFANAPGYYDYVAVTSNAYLVGKLSVNLINGYVPPSTKTNFIVLAVTGPGVTLSGSFANVLDNKVWCTDGYSRFDVLFNTPANKVILTNYAFNAWSPTSGSTWDTAANWS